MLTTRDVAEIRGDLRTLVTLARTAVDLLIQVAAQLAAGEQIMATSLHDLVTTIATGLADVGTKLDANTAALKADGDALTALVTKIGTGGGVAQEDLDALSQIAGRVTAAGQTVDAQTTALSDIATTIANATTPLAPTPAPTPAQ